MLPLIEITLWGRFQRKWWTTSRSVYNFFSLYQRLIVFITFVLVMGFPARTLFFQRKLQSKRVASVSSNILIEITLIASNRTLSSRLAWIKIKGLQQICKRAMEDHTLENCLLFTSSPTFDIFWWNYNLYDIFESGSPGDEKRTCYLWPASGLIFDVSYIGHQSFT